MANVQLELWNNDSGQDLIHPSGLPQVAAQAYSQYGLRNKVYTGCIEGVSCHLLRTRIFCKRSKNYMGYGAVQETTAQ